MTGHANSVGTRERSSRVVGWSAASVAALAPGRRSRRHTRRAMPTPRSLRPGRPPAATTGTLGPRTAASTRRGTGSARTSPAARSSSLPTPARTSCRARSWTSTCRWAAPPTAIWVSPTSMRAPGRAPGQPQHHVQRRRQAGHLLDAGHRRPGRARRRSTRRGTSSAARRVSSACPTEDETYRGDVVHPEVHRWRAVVRTGRPRRSPPTPPDLADQLAGLEIPGRRRRRRSMRPAAPPGGRWARWVPRRASRIRSAPTALGQNFAGGKIFYSPGDRRQRRHRPGAGEVRERRRARGRSRLPDVQRGRRRLATDSRMTTFAADGQAGHLLDARLRRRRSCAAR